MGWVREGKRKKLERNGGRELGKKNLNREQNMQRLVKAVGSIIKAHKSH